MPTISEKGLNANHLKVIAIIAMTIDHLTCVIFLIINCTSHTAITYDRQNYSAYYVVFCCRRLLPHP